MHEFENSGIKKTAGKWDGSWKKQKGQVKIFQVECLLLFKGVTNRVSEKSKTEHPRGEQYPEEEDPSGPGRETPDF